MSAEHYAVESSGSIATPSISSSDEGHILDADGKLIDYGHGAGSASGEDNTKDSTSFSVSVGKRRETRNSLHRTEWRKNDVTPTRALDEARWRSMWLFQTDQMGEAPVTSRAPSDTDARRERTDKFSVADRIADRLGCTSKQRERIVSKMGEIDVSVLGAHSDNRKAAVAIASIVTEERRFYSERDTRRVDYSSSITKPVTIENSDAFQNLCEEFDFNPEFLSTARKAIKKQLDECDTD